MRSGNNYGAIVLGVGAVGGATTYHLAKHGVSVLGLEQFGVPNGKGSSRGYTRVINPALREKPQYVELTNRALELWGDLQTTYPNDLFRQTGALRGWTGPEYTGVRNSFDEAVELCEEAGVPYEVMNGQEISERFIGYTPERDTKFLYQPDGGLLDPQECIIAHMNQAHEHGAEIRAHEHVDAWKSDGDTVHVQTTKGEYHADNLIVTAGPWIADVLEGTIDIHPTREVMGWFRLEDSTKSTEEALPSFGWDTENGYFYGTPSHRINGIKVGGGYYDEVVTVDPDTADLSVTSEEEEILHRFVESHLSSEVSTTLKLSACMTTSPEDKQYIIDSHPDHGNVHIAGGFSGSGFMTASAVGEVVTNQVLEGQTDIDLDPFGIDRL